MRSNSSEFLSALFGGGGFNQTMSHQQQNIPLPGPKDGGNLRNQEGLDGFLPNQSGIGMLN